VRHFHEIVRREHHLTLSYSYVKRALKGARLGQETSRARAASAATRAAGVFRGVITSGRQHARLAGVVARRAHHLDRRADDATNQVLHAALHPNETTQAVMTALTDVFVHHGLPLALYTDRAHWAFHTPMARGPIGPSRRRLTSAHRCPCETRSDHLSKAPGQITWQQQPLCSFS
jgi:hypothetical protein